MKTALIIAGTVAFIVLWQIVRFEHRFGALDTESVEEWEKFQKSMRGE